MFNKYDVFSVLETAKKFLKFKELPDYKSDSEVLLSFLLQIKRSRLPFVYNQVLSSNQLCQFEKYILRRAKREPVAYIIGHASFMEFEFKVDKSVLIPRPETEFLVEIVLNLAKKETNLKTLDLCTGSGCIAISLAKMGTFKTIIATDINKCALKLAKENAKINDVKSIKFIESDIFANLQQNRFDVIVSNPPYVSQKEYLTLEKDLMYEPKLALIAEDDGLFFYREIAENAKKFLNNTAHVVLELNPNKVTQIKQMFIDNNFKEIEIIKDYLSLPRVFKAKIFV
ncbi:MAG: peptide chain release factor N(5)-glutamine methyltransferase [Endomicrobium sp.]|jgi:release factor glutamine methyltransferase|nr:peptide chain release factor N(5)-glutamine methyltransferase [Endomicrobium sp.]